MAGRDFSERTEKADGVRALCRLYYKQALAACSADAEPDAMRETKGEAPSFRGRTVVLTGSVYAHCFLDMPTADKKVAGLRIAMSAQRRPCYRGRDVVPTFYLPGTPQAKRERDRTSIGARETEECSLRMLSVLFQTLETLHACPADRKVDVRLLALRVRAPAAVTGLGLCRALIGKTQKELAGLLGIGVKTYRLCEQGRRALSADMAKTVCELAGCRESILLSDEDVGWNAAQAVWTALSPDTRRRVSVFAALFLRIFCGANQEAAQTYEFLENKENEW